MAVGKIVQVIGTVVDVESPPDQLPNLFDALDLENSGQKLVLVRGESYEQEEVDEVYLAYSKFVSTMSQQSVVEKLLPVDPAPLSGPERSGYLYEPDAITVLGGLLPQFVDMQVYHAMLEAIASEQSARMVAMRSATDNANSLADELTLVMNKLRQDSITNELLDLVGGQMALEG